MNFQEAEKLFATARDPQVGKPLCNNTRLFQRAEDCYAVRLHKTDVVTLWRDGRVTLDTGGWRTMTTRQRIESYAPVRVRSERGVWYVQYRGTDPRHYVPFFDGVTFGPRGACLNGVKLTKWDKYLQDRAAMGRRIKAYAKGYVRVLTTEGLPTPGAGDCWFCAMRPVGGDVDNSVDHLLSHLDERYFVPSLAANALRAKGHKNEGICIYLSVSRDGERMGGRKTSLDGYVYRAIRDYLADRLLPEPPSQRATNRPLRAVNTGPNYYR